jgi:hypothetical protein
MKSSLDGAPDERGRCPGRGAEPSEWSLLEALPDEHSMALGFMGLTIVTNISIAGIASLIPKPNSAESFPQGVTGIDTSSKAATWESIKGAFSSFTQWQT